MFSPLPLKARVIKSAYSGHCFILSQENDERCRYPHYRYWQDVSMQKAAVEEGLSLRKAAELYEVPKSTLYDRVTGRTKFGAKSGPEGYLIAVEEAELLNFLLRCSDIGYAHSRKQILSIVQRIVDGKGINTIVTIGWWERFCQ